MSAFLQDVKPLSDEELQKLGIKVSLNIIYYLRVHNRMWYYCPQKLLDKIIVD